MKIDYHINIDDKVLPSLRKFHNRSIDDLTRDILELIFPDIKAATKAAIEDEIRKEIEIVEETSEHIDIYIPPEFTDFNQTP